MVETVLITGASSGLGLSHALYLTFKGYKVIGTSRNPETLDRDKLKEIFLRDHSKFKFTTKEKIEVKIVRVLAPESIINHLDDLIDQIEFEKMDVSSTSSVSKAIEKIQSQTDIDIIINNAGIGFFGPVEELGMEDMEVQFNTNIYGPIRVLKSVLPAMRTRMSGRIINTSSLGGVTCIPFQAHYSASKAALMRITESLSLELKPFNIKVSSLLPGDINTNFDATTVKLHHQGMSLISSDISQMLKSIPVPSTSPYFRQASIAWNSIIRNLILSPPPLNISKKVHKILITKKPKLHYKAGPRLQTLGITLLKRLFSESYAYKIVSKFYGL